MSVYQRGGVWWFKFAFRGQTIRESTHRRCDPENVLIGRAGAKADERLRRNELSQQMRNTKVVKPINLATAAKLWIETRRAHWRPATLSAETYNLNHLLPVFGKRLLTDITADRIAKYQGDRVQEGASGRTVNMEVGTLRAILRKHRLWAAVQPDVKPLPARSDIGRALSRDEEMRLLVAVRKSRSRSLFPALLLSIHTGLRLKELRTLQWGLVDLLEGYVTVGQSKTKGGEGRRIPLSASALATLQDWRAIFPEATPEHYVFPTEKVGLNGVDGCTTGATIAYSTDPTKPMGSWKIAFRGAQKAAGVKCRWHDLRHTFISRCAEGGAADQTLTALGGWMSPKMLETYSHARMEAKRRAVAVFDQPEDAWPLLRGGHKSGHSIETPRDASDTKLLN